VWLGVGPADGPEVAVVAHVDQIGLIVTYIDEHGYVFIDKIGGVAPILVPGRHFVIHGSGGAVHAVGGKKPTHLIPRTSATERRRSTSSSSTSAPAAARRPWSASPWATR